MNINASPYFAGRLAAARADAGDPGRRCVVRARVREPGRRPGRAGVRRRLDGGRRRRRAARPGAAVRRAGARRRPRRAAGLPQAPPRPSGPRRHRTAHRHRRHRATPSTTAPDVEPVVDARARAGRRGVRRPRPRHCATTWRKNGFTDVVLGLSGGIDSSLVACIAADALGPEHVPRCAHAVALLERGLRHRRRGAGRQPRRRPPHHRHRGRLRAVPRAAGAVVRGPRARPHRGEPPEPHPRDAPDGAVEQVRVDGGHHRQQERDGGGLLHPLRRHGRRLRRHQGRPQAAGVPRSASTSTPRRAGR